MASQIGMILNSMQASLQTAVPTRTVTRSLRDFADRSKEELAAGIYTLISRGEQRIDAPLEFLGVLLVGQFEVAENATGEVLEEIELRMFDEVRYFAAGCQGAYVQVQSTRQSMQIEHPYGWINAELLVGPFSLPEIIDPATLDDFITFHADYDLAPADLVVDAAITVTLEQ